MSTLVDSLHRAPPKPVKADTGYGIGHPWHYVLGGDIPTPKQILAYVDTDYRGHREREIAAAHRVEEPRRSKRLQTIREEVKAALRADLSRYRKLACRLRAERRETPDFQAEPFFTDLPVSISLKFAHVYNGFAHLRYLESLPSPQPDLFDFLR